MSDPAAALGEPSQTPEHPIAVVERRTGVSQHVLRAWERRYRVVEPPRDAAGERLYSDADIERLRLVRELTAGGRRVGQVAALDLAALRELAARDASEAVIPPRPASAEAPAARDDAEAAEHLAMCRDAVDRLDSATAHALLIRAAVALGPRRFVDGVAAPLLRAVGDAWEQGALRPMHEHGMSVAMRRVLSWLVEALPAPTDAPLVVVGTPAGQRHEFGAMLAAVVAAARQWRVVYLGPDLPAAEIAHGARVAGADVVALSVLAPIDARALGREIETLRDALPATTALVFGGAAALQHPRVTRARGAELLADLDAWDAWLAARAAAGQPSSAGASA
jgi:DNA-binding transcriptional MerR regulator/methylmalonyl-CoA mutase cobalamin-binding subunit